MLYVYLYQSFYLARLSWLEEVVLPSSFQDFSVGCTEFESRETFTHFYSLHPIAWQSPVILVFAFQSPVVNPTKSAMSVPASAATTTSHCFSWWTCKAPILGETCRNIQGLSPLVEHNKANHKTKAKLRTPKISRDFSQTKMIENQCSWIRQCRTVTGTMPPNP